jgi:hypothetical protein
MIIIILLVVFMIFLQRNIFSSSDTTKIILPKIDDEKSIFYIIRKHYIDTVSLLPHNEDNIEGDSSITITSDDQIIQLTNDSLHTWLLL